MEVRKRAARNAVYAVLVICVCFSGGCVMPAPPAPIVVNASAAAIVEVANGEILFEKNADKRFPPASTAKVMTAIIALERLPLEAEITVSKNAAGVEAVVAGFEPGTEYRLKDLLAAILVKSCNDAAVVIAEGVAGNEKDFVSLMNARAQMIGMEDTYFATASGLPTGRKDKQYTTAKDLCMMMRYALRYRIILEMMSRKEASIRGSDGRFIRLGTHNRTLLWDGETSWGKTGYTKEAKRTFVGVDPCFRPRIIFALLRSDKLWSDMTILKQRGLELYGQRYKTVVSLLVDWLGRARVFAGRK